MRHSFTLPRTTESLVLRVRKSIAVIALLSAGACAASNEGALQEPSSAGEQTKTGVVQLAAVAREAAGCEGAGHIYRADGDGGAPSTIEARCAAIVVEGTTCAVMPSDVGLSLGLDGHGWTVHASAPCFGGAALTISGVDDAPYPQVAVQPFLKETSAWLFLTNEGSDAGLENGSYVSNPSGASTLEIGPENKSGEKVVTTIAGVAEVVSQADASQRRKVQFYFAF